jgi:hypothetical protein
MKRILLILSGALLLASSLFWLLGGAHRGWTKTSVPVKTLDEVTGIEGIQYESRFVPGIDFLAGGLLLAAALAGSSCFFRNKNDRQLTQPTT